MDAPDSPAAASYQWILRVIGAYLDGENARDISLLEGMEDLLVWYRTEGGVRSPVTFSHAELRRLEEEFKRKRSGGLRLWGRILPPTQPGGYQDLLRAIGHELDTTGARALMLDQLNESYLVTYSYVEPSQGFNWRKHMAVLDRTAQEQLLATARARRGQAARRSPARG